jgi:hypothetical protein
MACECSENDDVGLLTCKILSGVVTTPFLAELGASTETVLRRRQRHHLRRGQLQRILPVLFPETVLVATQEASSAKDLPTEVVAPLLVTADRQNITALNYLDGKYDRKPQLLT